MNYFICLYSPNNLKKATKESGKIGENETIVYNREKGVNLDVIISSIAEKKSHYHIFYVPEAMKTNFLDAAKKILNKEISLFPVHKDTIPKKEESHTTDAKNRDNSTVTETYQLEEKKMSTKKLATLINAVQSWSNGIDVIRIFNLKQGAIVDIDGIESNGALGNVTGLEQLLSTDSEMFDHFGESKQTISDLLSVGQSNLMLVPFEKANIVFYYVMDSKLNGVYLIVFAGNKDTPENLNKRTSSENMANHKKIPMMLEHIDWSINNYPENSISARTAKLERDGFVEQAIKEKEVLPKGFKKLLMEYEAG